MRCSVIVIVIVIAISLILAFVVVAAINVICVTPLRNFSHTPAAF